ncbi:MAG: rRNA maturation RNase YbeY [Candidatus Pacebacteria bacterium]|nr:rRNA maturation RNase YbeY [Candidatus Paceibacterota bacterium]
MTDRASHCVTTSVVRRNVDTSGLCTIARHILGETYTLSIVIVGDTRARTLNRTYRNKDYAPNVLSFPLDELSGEIYLNIARITRECRSFELSPNGHLRYLLIHGCLHLKGHHHGSTMERTERELVEQFSIR